MTNMGAVAYQYGDLDNISLYCRFQIISGKSINTRKKNKS